VLKSTKGGWGDLFLERKLSCTCVYVYEFFFALFWCVESTSACVCVSELLHPTLRDNVVIFSFKVLSVILGKLLALPSKIFLLYELKILKLYIMGLLLVTIF
jgi:hypothetical protein